MAGTGSSPSSGPGHFDNTLCQPRHQGQGPIACPRRMRLAAGGWWGRASRGLAAHAARRASFHTAARNRCLHVLTTLY